jgi:NADH-quinone oxidoreductase subunit H
LHFLAPVLLVAASFMGFAVLPIGRNMVIANLNAGVLFFFAVGSLMELAVFMAGWSSRSKYSLLGAMRAIAQMISYEVPLVLAAIVVIMQAGSLSTVSIVDLQASYTGIWPHWFVFTPWGFAGFVLFMVAATAESNRSPFDLPEGESEIIAGYYTEYSGFKFALFFLGEYIGMFATSAMAITLFLGGWSAPFSFLTWVPSYVWFFVKLLAIISVFIWIRGTLPRLRMDQLMNLAWQFMLPMTLLNLFTAGLWHFMTAGSLRWLVCSTMVVVPFILLGRGLKHNKKFQARTYRYSG